MRKLFAGYYRPTEEEFDEPCQLAQLMGSVLDLVFNSLER